MDIILQANRRQKGPRSILSRLRKEGQLPAVIYGYNTETIPVTLDYGETSKAVQQFGRTSVFKIDIEGKQVNAVLTEIQRDALKGFVKHVDFLSINLTEELQVEVPVNLVGDSTGVKEGGVLNQPVRELTIKVKPTEMPDAIDIDITSLGIGESLSVADIKSRVQYNILSPDEDILATVTPPVVVNDDTAGQGDTENQDIKASGAPESEN